jgi:hypothetical protein
MLVALGFIGLADAGGGVRRLGWCGGRRCGALSEGTPHRHTTASVWRAWQVRHTQTRPSRVSVAWVRRAWQVARVAAAYVAPLGLLVHVVAAPYLYTVVATCPEALWCAPTAAVMLPAALMATVGVLLVVVWQVPLPPTRMLHMLGCRVAPWRVAHTTTGTRAGMAGDWRMAGRHGGRLVQSRADGTRPRPRGGSRAADEAATGSLPCC